MPVGEGNGNGSMAKPAVHATGLLGGVKGGYGKWNKRESNL